MTKKLKIYINGLFWGQEITGVQKFAFALCYEMALLGAELVFLCPKSIKNDPPFGSIVRFGNLKGHSWEQYSLPIFLRKKKIKTLLNLCNSAPYFFEGNIVCIHDISFHKHQQWFSKTYAFSYKLLTPRIVKRAKQILTVSEFSKKQISKTYSIKPEQIRIIYNGIFFNKTTIKNIDYEIPEKYILFVGSLSPRKNLSMLIEAIEEMGDKSLKLIVVGKRNKIFKSEELSHPAFIEFHKNTNDAELQNLYKNAKLLVMPSFYEGFGLPILEALNFGCPVICSDIPVFRELFEDYVTFFDLESKKDLKQKISLILSDGIKIKINTKELIKKYNYSKGAKLILDIVKD